MTPSSIALSLWEWLKPVQTTAALAVFFVVFAPLERIFPLRPQRILRPQFVTDLGHFFMTQWIVKTLVFLVGTLLLSRLGSRVPKGIPLFCATLPIGVQFGAALLLQDLGFYWGHRLVHAVPFLWRFHAVHHSAEGMDWLVSTRFHPLDQSIIRFCSILPVFLGGFNVTAFAMMILFQLFHGFFVHANVRFKFLGLERFIVTPLFHHWHHVKEDGGKHRNFSGLVSFYDWLFKTGREESAFPMTYGTGESVPANYWGQILRPFWKG